MCNMYLYSYDDAGALLDHYILVGELMQYGVKKMRLVYGFVIALKSRVNYFGESCVVFFWNIYRIVLLQHYPLHIQKKVDNFHLNCVCITFCTRSFLILKLLPHPLHVCWYVLLYSPLLTLALLVGSIVMLISFCLVFVILVMF